MARLLVRFKPGVRRSTHLLLAALLWTAVGGMLSLRGLHTLWANQLRLLLLPALVAGTLKSYYILDQTAKKGIHRIQSLEDGACVGAVYSIRIWLLVLVMTVMGIFLRKASLPAGVIGALYMTIGWALLFSSRHAWQAWLIELRK